MTNSLPTRCFSWRPLASGVVRVEGLRQGATLVVHRRPAVDEAYQVEGAAEHARVLAQRDGFGVGHVGAGEGVDDAVLADDALGPVGRCGGGRDAHDAAQVAAGELVDVVMIAAGAVSAR